METAKIAPHRRKDALSPFTADVFFIGLKALEN